MKDRVIPIGWKECPLGDALNLINFHSSLGLPRPGKLSQRWSSVFSQALQEHCRVKSPQ